MEDIGKARACRYIALDIHKHYSVVAEVVGVKQGMKNSHARNYSRDYLDF